ncbi:MAG: hypothetical protein LBK59_05470, partial [Bifidobacteriaceae bacterium]|nr:hypothetical protein [Bifidobacteriaceae bacterium]
MNPRREARHAVAGVVDGRPVSDVGAQRERPGMQAAASASDSPPTAERPALGARAEIAEAIPAMGVDTP